MKFPNIQHSIAIFASSIAAALATPHAVADITAANWVDDTHFNYRVLHMPDLDQRRHGLGDECNGNMHCFPTSASNLMLYIANHGFPAVPPGPGYWEGDTNYDQATTVVGLMGVLMQTNCDSGTTGQNAQQGTIDWLAGNPEFVVNDHLSIEGFAPTHTGIGKSLCGGRIGRVGYGFYDVIGDLKGIPLVDRTGGHSVTVVKIRRNGATREMWVHDPATDEGDLDSQSPFVNNVWSVTDLTVIVMPDMDMKTMTAINYTPGDSTIYLIDGHGSIRPKDGYTFSSSLTSVQLHLPTNLANPGAPPTTTFPSPTGGIMLGIGDLDFRQELLVVCTSPSSPPALYAIDRLTGSSHPVPTTITPSLVSVGRSDQAYVAGGNEIELLSYSFGRASGSQTLPFAADAMIYDDANDQVVVLSGAAHKIMRCKRDLSVTPMVFSFPTTVPIGGPTQLAINPTDGAIWLWTSATVQLWRLTPGGPGALNALPFTLPTINSPQGISFDDQGHMYVSNAGAIVELKQGSTGWQVVPGGMFSGLPGFRGLGIARSRTNAEPGVHDTPAWSLAIDPATIPSTPEAPSCAADIAPFLNIDGIVNLSDLLLVINSWGACASEISCPADIDENGFVNTADLLLVINSWGACP